MYVCTYACVGGGAAHLSVIDSAAISTPRRITSYPVILQRGANKVPVVSLAIVALTSLLFICIGDVNFLAPIVTMPFLVTYIAVDYAYFALAMTADQKTHSAKAKADTADLATAEKTYGSTNNQREDDSSSTRLV